MFDLLKKNIIQTNYNFEYEYNHDKAYVFMSKWL